MGIQFPTLDALLFRFIEIRGKGSDPLRAILTVQE